MSPRNALQPYTGTEEAERSQNALQPYTGTEEADRSSNALQSYTNIRRCSSGRCGRPAVPNRHLCHACLEIQKAGYWQAVRDGLCIRCRKQPAQEGHRRCAACAEKIRQASTALYQRTKQKGLCTYCRHQGALPHKEVCFACFKKHASLRRARRQHTQAQWLSWLLIIMLWPWGQRQS